MDKKTVYVEKLSAQMVEWDNEIQRLKDKAESAGAESRLEYSQTVAALQLKRDEAARKLQGVSTASDHAWEELKEGTDQVWDEVRTNLRNAILKIK